MPRPSKRPLDPNNPQKARSTANEPPVNRFWILSREDEHQFKVQRDIPNQLSEPDLDRTTSRLILRQQQRPENRDRMTADQRHRYFQSSTRRKRRSERLNSYPTTYIPERLRLSERKIDRRGPGAQERGGSNPHSRVTTNPDWCRWSESSRTPFCSPRQSLSRITFCNRITPFPEIRPSTTTIAWKTDTMPTASFAITSGRCSATSSTRTHLPNRAPRGRRIDQPCDRCSWPPPRLPWSGTKLSLRDL